MALRKDVRQRAMPASIVQTNDRVEAVWPDEDGEGALIGLAVRGMDSYATVRVSRDEIAPGRVYGICGDFKTPHGAPYSTARDLLRIAARWLDERGVMGVLIATENETNDNRRFYKKMGFVPVNGIPFLRGASMADIKRRLKLP